MNLKTALEWIQEIHLILNSLRSKYEDETLVQAQIITNNSVSITTIGHLRELAIDIEQGFMRWYIHDTMDSGMLTQSLIMLFDICKNIRRI